MLWKLSPRCSIAVQTCASSRQPPAGTRLSRKSATVSLWHASQLHSQIQRNALRVFEQFSFNDREAINTKLYRSNKRVHCFPKAPPTSRLRAIPAIATDVGPSSGICRSSRRTTSHTCSATTSQEQTAAHAARDRLTKADRRPPGGERAGSGGGTVMVLTRARTMVARS